MVKVTITYPAVSPETLSSFLRGGELSYHEAAVLSQYSPEFAERVLRVKNIRMRGFSPTAPKLFPHQERALAWMVRAVADRHPYGIKGGLLELEAGLGKTYLTCFYLLSRPTVARSSIVVVKSSIVDVWRDCLARWFPQANVVEVLSNSPAEVTVDSLSASDIVITTYSCLRSYNSRHVYVSDAAINHRTPEEVRACRPTGHAAIFGVIWDNVVFDESHAMANRKTKTFAACLALTGAAYWCLSGTPFRNNTTDFWSQYRILGYVGSLKEWKTPGIAAIHQLAERHLKMTYVSAGVEMPLKHDYIVRVSLHGKFKEVYGKVLGAVEEAVDTYFRDKKFACILSLFVRLRQVMVSPALLISGDLGKGKVTRVVEDILSESWVASEEAWRQAPKIVTAMDIIAKSVARGLKVIVFSSFKGTLAFIRKLYDESGLGGRTVTLTGDANVDERDVIAHSFSRDPETKVLLATYSTGGEGLTFTSASVVIYVDDWWTSAAKAQAGSRSWRIGQSSTVHAFTLYADNTIDARIREVCNGKVAAEHAFTTGASRKASTETTPGFGIEHLRLLFARN